MTTTRVSLATRHGGLGRVLHEALSDALAVFAPSECIGCGRADRGFCAACAATLAKCAPHRAQRAEHTVWCGSDYDGLVRSALLAFKDGGRTEIARVLAQPLIAAIAAALGECETTQGTGPIELATIPSASISFRQRGFHPVNTLLAAGGLRAASVLRFDAMHQDQVGLGREARQRNLSGSLQARDAPFAGVSVHGRRFLLVDDILTTGATISEAARALRAAGAEVCGFAVLADTRLRKSTETQQ